MKLKICGITNQKDLELCIKYADAVGFIVEYPQSPRSISIEKAKELIKAVPPFMTNIIVVPDFKKAMQIYSKLRPSVIQLHGKETVNDVKKFREKVDCKIIKACGVKNALEFSRHADAVLIDDKYSKINLDEVNEVIKKIDKPVILAGHLTPENILDVLEKVRPYAVDVASGVEIKPGKKDPDKVKQLKKKLELGKTLGDIVKNKSFLHSFRFYEKLSIGNDLKIITEIKPASPAKGRLQDVSKNLKEIINAMENGGASAISVLVEKEKFDGSIELLKKVRNLTGLPVLAKGFFFNMRQLAEVALAGADAFLLMIRVVEAQGQSVRDLLNFGRGLGLDAVVEISNREELDKALSSGARIIEINNRDIYGDLNIDLKNVMLGRNLPNGIIFISASGIENAADIQEICKISRSCVDAVLVGTSIMQSENIKDKVSELVKTGIEVSKATEER